MLSHFIWDVNCLIGFSTGWVTTPFKEGRKEGGLPLYLSMATLHYTHAFEAAARSTGMYRCNLPPPPPKCNKYSHMEQKTHYYSTFHAIFLSFLFLFLQKRYTHSLIIRLLLKPLRFFFPLRDLKEDEKREKRKKKSHKLIFSIYLPPSSSSSSEKKHRLFLHLQP